MKIGFDVSQTGTDKAGCGYFADSLIRALTDMDRANEYILYPHFGTHFWDPDGRRATRQIDRANVSRIVTGDDFQQSRAFWNQSPQQVAQGLGNPDIVHANNFFCPRGLGRVKVVYTLYDLSFLVHPEFTSEQNRWACFEGVFDAACYADFMVAISNHTRKGFLETFPHYPADRVRVVPLGSRFSSLAGEVRGSAVEGLVPGRFWLAVGTLEPRKNLRRLLRAHAAVTRQNPENYPLVLAGGKGWLEEDLEAFIGALEIRDRVKVLGYVGDGTLGWLYRHCHAFLYPSLFEGFGLPVLEALGFGAAVVTSKVTSLPEVAGEAALYVDPWQEQDLVSAMSRLLHDEGFRQVLKSRAQSQVRTFSWAACAAEILAIYQSVVRLPGLDGKGIARPAETTPSSEK
jgi:glycosyltransferase involved in cell wall biosynthesis